MLEDDVQRVYLAISNAQDGELYFKGQYTNPKCLYCAAQLINTQFLSWDISLIMEAMLKGQVLDGRVYNISYALHCGKDWKIKVNQ